MSMSTWGKHLLVGVVHVVGDGVKAGLVGAGIAGCRASRSILRLSSSVGNEVTVASAAALEGVEQTEPVADLVGGGVTKVEIRLRTAGDGGGVDDNTVEGESLGAGCNGPGEIGISEPRSAGKEVDVQVTVSTLAESLLHGQLSPVVGIVGVDSPVHTSLSERDAVRSKGLVQDLKLLGKGCLSEVTASNGLVIGSDVPVDLDLEVGSSSKAPITKTRLRLQNLEVLGNLDLLSGSVGGTAATLGSSQRSEQREDNGLELHFDGWIGLGTRGSK